MSGVRNGIPENVRPLVRRTRVAEARACGGGGGLVLGVVGFLDVSAGPGASRDEDADVHEHHDDGGDVERAQRRVQHVAHVVRQRAGRVVLWPVALLPAKQRGQRDERRQHPHEADHQHGTRRGALFQVLHGLRHRPVPAIKLD